MLINGQTVGEIAQVLNVSPKTVSTYKYRLLEKAEVRNEVELIHLALRYGLLQNNTENQTAPT